VGTYFKAIDTSEGLVHVLTKTRWLGLIPMPHTSVMPQGAADLKRLGTFIKWTTKDATTLATLHEATVRLVQQNGVSGLAEIGKSVKMTERVASAVGGDWHDIVKQAARDGVAFPVPDEVLRYIKGFM
jgi:hypothetical protein